ncbi:MAG: sirohydrochlorin cobaltochelatase [Clostridia bacterium]|nr:sirohydrochlorin cobaltochelatase [Clostridia bacterium]
MKQLISMLLALSMLFGLMGFALAEEEDEENYETGDATLDLVRNEDEIGDKELLVVSFGTSFNDSRRLTIGGIEAAIDEAVEDYSVRRAFTAQIIIDHVEKRDGIHIDNVTEALDRAVVNGVKVLVVQPTHLMHGYEYDDVVAELAGYADAFEQIVVSEPLLTSEEDFDRVADIMIDLLKDYDDGKTAIVYMGHGTEHEYNKIYAQMQDVLTSKGAENYYIGTVEAAPSIDDVLEAIKDKGYTRVVLRDMVVVCGDHANNDMAGDEEDSWKSIFTAAGFEVECVMEGLGQVPEIQQIYVEHAQNAIAQVNN